MSQTNYVLDGGERRKERNETLNREHLAAGRRRRNMRRLKERKLNFLRFHSITSN